MSVRESPAVIDNGVLRFLTAGSVDDGKSTLIGRLLYDTKAILADQLAAVARISRQRGQELDLSLLTDGLMAEREQGITIDVAYRYFATAARKFIIADAPGHEQYTRNMVTAASTAHLAILMVDARHGVVRQTRRHATLAHLLGIPHLVVAINKMDLVGFSEGRFTQIVAEFSAFAQRSHIDAKALQFVPLSALDGDMVVDRGTNLDWYSGPTLLQLLETAPILAGSQDSFRFPVQFVAAPTAASNRGCLGRVEGGSISVGDGITVLPSGRTTSIRDIRTYAGVRATASLHESVAITLADDIDISRGDMLVSSDAAVHGTRSLDATLCWLDDRPLDLHRTYLLRHTTRAVRARVDRLASLWNVSTQQAEAAPATLGMNDIGEVTLDLDSPIAADKYVDNHATGSFILIDETTNGTAAAGLIR